MKVSEEAMFFEQPFAIADCRVMTLDKNWAVFGDNNARRGKWAWAYGSDADGLAERGELGEEGAQLGERERRPVRCDECAVKAVGAGGSSHLAFPFVRVWRPALQPVRGPALLLHSSKRVVRVEAHRRGRSEPEKSVAVARAGVRPIALVGDVVGVDMEVDAALLAARRVTRAEVNDVDAGHADDVVARGLFG